MKLRWKIFLFLISFSFLSPETNDGIPFSKKTSKKKGTSSEGVFDKETSINTIVAKRVLSMENNALPIKQEHLANDLLSDSFPFENTQCTEFLPHRFSLPIKDGNNTLSSLTPELYATLPLTQNQIIYYLPCLSIPTYATDEKNTCRVVSFYHTIQYNKEKPKPGYECNTMGVSANVCRQEIFFILGSGVTYGLSDTRWKNQSGHASTHNIYLHPSLSYNHENLFCRVTILGGYTLHHVKRILPWATFPHAKATPHSWELAAKLYGGYRYNTNYATFIPQLNFTQINVFQSSIKENTPKGNLLKTASKNFRYLNMSFSLQIQREIKNLCYRVTPSLRVGWHHSRLLSDKNFHSKIGGYNHSKKNFIMETYTGDTALFFLESSLSTCPVGNRYWELSYRAEWDKKIVTYGFSGQVTWGF